MEGELKCEVRGLGHRYGSKFLIRDISFCLFSGNLHFFRGLNGAGKSTLLKIISHGLEPVEGKVDFYFDGKPWEREIILSQMGFVAPYQELPEELSLRELIDFQLNSRPEIDQLEGYLQRTEWFGMTQNLDRYVQHYSTGMKQKARLILGLCEKRKIWILDEPGSNLDPDSFQLLWKFVVAGKQNRLILVASNDPDELALADSIVTVA